MRFPVWFDLPILRRRIGLRFARGPESNISYRLGIYGRYAERIP